MTWSRFSGRNGGTPTATRGQTIPGTSCSVVISQRTLEFPYSLTFCFSGVHSEEARWIHAPCLKLQARGLTSDLPPCTSPLPSSLFYPSHVSLWEAADLLSIPHQQESTWGLEGFHCFFGHFSSLGSGRTGPGIWS